jgi:hypothetical protein
MVLRQPLNANRQIDLPRGRPSFITRVLGVDSCRFRVLDARQDLSLSMKLGGLTSIGFGAEDCEAARAWMLLR